MFDILDEREAVPAAFPGYPSWLSPDAMAIPQEAVWGRIESWITRRYPVRSATWIISGCGEFVPRLMPAVLTLAEQWDDRNSVWTAFTPTQGPIGLCLDDGTYRLTFDVGEAAPPGDVMEAVARLAEYWTETADDAGLLSVTDGDYSATRSANAVGNALQLSGAADLLRRYR